ncbi:MAG TPA: hypothetical protein VK742_00795 [Candidatus Sulfotelmatobacter sp.]|nr:hypothetical protein [Candidatus Sulfotelmatobacter sp.]
MFNPEKKPTPFPIGIFFSVFMVVFSLVFGWAAIRTAIEPRSYVGDAQIEVHLYSDSDKKKPAYLGYDFVRNEAEFIKSETLLRLVINNLDLNDVWGKKYDNDETLKTWESLKILNDRMLVVPIRDTTIIRIRIYDENPKDAAALANAVVNSYVNYVATNSPNLSASVIDNAYEENKPVRPNVTLNMFWGVMTGIFIGGIFAIAAALFAYSKRRNQRAIVLQTGEEPPPLPPGVE